MWSLFHWNPSNPSNSATLPTVAWHQLFMIPFPVGGPHEKFDLCARSYYYAWWKTEPL